MADPSDGRARLVTITAKGQELVELSLPVVREIERSWTKHLGPARTRQLREALVELRVDHRPVPGVTRLMRGSLGSFQEAAHHGHMTTFKRLVRRFDAYTLEVFNPPQTRRPR